MKLRPRSRGVVSFVSGPSAAVSSVKRIVGPSPRHHTDRMSNDEHRRVSEGMAAQLWQRAAQLQAEAARHEEARSLMPVESETSDEDATGYTLTHVRQAAEEAGIGGEFLDAALAEVAAGVAVADHQSSVLERVALRLLESPPDSLEVRRVIEASAEDVYQTMQIVFPEAPYYLALRAIHGDVLHGGVMVFDLPAVTLSKWLYDLSYTGTKQLVASIHRVDENSCEVVVRGSLRRGRRIAGGVFGTVTAGATGFGALAGGVGLSVAVAAGLGVGTLGLVPLVAGFGLLGGASLGGVSRAMSRKLYVYFLDRGVKAMEGLLRSLNLSVVSAWGTGGGPSRAGDATAQGQLGKPTK